MSEGKKSGGMLNDLLTNENLEYNLPSNATVVVEKNQKVFFFDKTTYVSGEDRMVITLNSGGDFIDGRNSYLAFKLKLAGAAPDAVDFQTFGEGSACNLFQELLIRSRDGEELERIRNLNSLCATKGRWMNAQDYLDKLGSMSGYRSNKLSSTTGATTAPFLADAYSDEELGAAKYAGKVFCIPMRDISALFDTDKLLPSFLMAGLRLEFILAPLVSVIHSHKAYAGNVYADGAKDPTSYTISDPLVRLQTLKLSDSVMNKLTEVAANKGLVIPINTWDLTPATCTAKLNGEVRRNVSQLLSVIVKPRLTADISSQKKDSMASERAHKVTSYRFRLGSSFIPSSSITEPNEHYCLAQLAFNKFKRADAENAVSLKKYLLQGAGIIASDLERSAIDLSGVAISNSKILAIEADFSDATARTVDIFIHFTRVITSFLTNTLVED